MVVLERQVVMMVDAYGSGHSVVVIVGGYDLG